MASLKNVNKNITCHKLLHNSRFRQIKKKHNNHTETLKINTPIQCQQQRCVYDLYTVLTFVWGKQL